jgi:hypothetical protein
VTEDEFRCHAECCSNSSRRAVYGALPQRVRTCAPRHFVTLFVIKLSGGTTWGLEGRLACTYYAFGVQTWQCIGPKKIRPLKKVSGENEVISIYEVSLSSWFISLLSMGYYRHLFAKYLPQSTTDLHQPPFLSLGVFKNIFVYSKLKTVYD